MTLTLPSSATEVANGCTPPSGKVSLVTSFHRSVPGVRRMTDGSRPSATVVPPT